MFANSGLFVFLLTVFQVSARFKPVIPNGIENEISLDSSSSNRILWGWDARPGEFPHHVSLRRVRHTGSVWRASGAIISREWIVTVAHIFTNTRSLNVRFGVSFINPDFTLEATEWYIHSSYNNQSAAVQPNDIALVKLPRPLVYSKFVQPIRIQRSADAYRDYDGERAYISAHGQTEIHGAYSDALRWTYLRTVTNSECANETRHAVATVICARYYNITSQCPDSEDAGAPLVHVGPDGIPTLIGLYSFRISACSVRLPYGYTRPGPYLTWFKEVTGIDFENLEEDVTTTTTSTPAPTTTSSTTLTTDLIPTDSTEQEPEYTTPDDIITTPDGSGEGDDSDDSGSDQDDDVAQLLKRLQVLVKVKVRMDKFNTTKAVGMVVDQKH